MYVLQRVEDKAFVTPPGLHSSYTKKLQGARIFSTKEEALRDKCGNERVLSLEEAVRRG